MSSSNNRQENANTTNTSNDIVEALIKEHAQILQSSHSNIEEIRKKIAHASDAAEQSNGALAFNQ